MRLSKLFTKTLRDAPASETAKNAQLLIRAGFIHKVMAGVYAYTPLGIKTLENIKQIVREEMNAVDGQELIMTNLQPRVLWESTGRWDDEAVDIWFKTKLKDNTELGLAWSHEEAVVEMMKQYVGSYKDLPISVYQFQTKLRNELRAKSGIMRGREFIMKDMYSLSEDAAQHNEYYNSVIKAYEKVYDRLGIGRDTYITWASGGAFTQFSHEFQTVCDAGEDVIYLHRGKNIAINKEVLNEDNLKKLEIRREELEVVKSSEVGNIFNFGTDKSQQMNFSFTNITGEKKFVHLGSYGIGITRIMGVIAEKFSDEKGLVWPETVTPFRVYLVQIGETTDGARQLYEALEAKGISVLWDDRDERPGAKFADADLLGMPHRIVISPKLLDESKYEYKARQKTQNELLTREALLAKLA